MPSSFPPVGLKSEFQTGCGGERHRVILVPDETFCARSRPIDKTLQSVLSAEREPTQKQTNKNGAQTVRTAAPRSSGASFVLYIF